MLRVPTVSGKEAVCGAGIRGPQQTYLGEGLADSEIGRFLEIGGSLVSPRALVFPLC